MFKPTINNFNASCHEHSTNLGNFARLEAMIESNGQVVNPHFAFVAGLEYMDMDSFRQIVTVKADSVTILKEHRRRGYVFLTNTLPGSCLSSRFISSPKSATETAEAGKPLRRMRSSMDTSSLSTKS